jgi:BlaI family transcriptional regulator, penicillinase repressor
VSRRAASIITEAELEVLKVLWERPSATVREVHAALAQQGRQQAYNTVLTLLQRLEAKEFVQGDKGGPANVYRAAVSRESLLNRRLAELADQLCDGTSSPLLLALVEGGRFTAEEIRQLREMLDRLEPPRRGRPRTG